MKKAVYLLVKVRLTGDFPPEFDVSTYAQEELRHRCHMNNAKSRHYEEVRVLSITDVSEEGKDSGDENYGVTLPPVAGV